MSKARIFILFLFCSLQALAQPGGTAGFRYEAKDSVVTVISDQYGDKSFLHRLVMGKNYRKTWSTPVKLPVFRLSHTNLTIQELGGGEQTKSLQLVDAEGKEWALRTIDKDVTLAVPPRLRNTVAQKIVQDMISAAHPFSHVIVGHLSKAAGIKASMPVIYFVADDPALKEYRNIFANTVCMLETKEPLPVGDIDETEEVIARTTEKNSHLVMQEKVLKSRLMDMLVGDWDRHEGQWTWSEKDSAGTRWFHVIPKDRDNALFYSNGLLPKITQLFFMPHLSGFKKKSSGLKKLNAKALEFDRQFLNSLDREEWTRAIINMQQQLTDSVIEASVRAIPEPVYRLDGDELVEKLKSRRDGLLQNGLEYYAQLSRNITINGSDENEIFTAQGDGKNVKILVSRISSDGSRQTIFERTINPSETRSVSLVGFAGDDRFEIEASAKAPLRLHIFGNEGNDHYSVKGSLKTKIIDGNLAKNITADQHAAKLGGQ